MALWHIVVAGGAVVGGAVLYRVLRAPAPTPTPAKDACDKLEELGVPKEAVQACRAAKTLAGLLPDLESTKEHNRKLNGAPALTSDAGMVAALANKSVNTLRPLSEWVNDLEYQNGCVPIEGHPGWSQCAPGTKSIAHASAGSDLEKYWRNNAPAGYTRAALMSGDPMRDLFTYRWTPERQTNAEKVLKRDVTFPVPVPAGAEAWFVRGRPVVCAAGTTVNKGRDHREGAPICAPPVDYSGVTAPSITPLGGYKPSERGVRAADCRSAGPNYILDCTDPSNCYCRRRRVGELGDVVGTAPTSQSVTFVAPISYRSDPPR